MRLSRQGPSLIVQTPAKLNLFLDVLGRRPDGFHDLETLMVSIRIYDTIRFELRPESGIELSCPTSSAIPLDSRNLIVRAARCLQQSNGVSAGARVTLWKRIPVEAGMGGGSSDAAATLVALNLLWGLNLDRLSLHELAAELGSDVNFFVDSAPASICLGRGEKTSPVPVRRLLHFVVVKPPSGLSTARVFREWAAQQTKPVQSIGKVASYLSGNYLGQLRHTIDNSLQVPACRLNGDIDRVLQEFERRDVMSYGMTGSGSACYALCRSARHARQMARQLQTINLGKVFAVSSGV